MAALMVFSVWVSDKLQFVVDIRLLLELKRQTKGLSDIEKQKPLHLNQKGRNGQRLAVSPFDGVNRIRFKGSPNIADLAIANAQTLSRHCGSPETYLIFNRSKGF
jgi:hypothetical protein